MLDLEDDLLLTLAFVLSTDRLPTHAMHRHSKIVWKAPVVSSIAHLVSFSSTCKALQQLLQPQLKAMKQQLLEEIRATNEVAQIALKDETLLLFSSALLPPSPPEQMRRRSSMPSTLFCQRDEMLATSDPPRARYRALRMLHAPRRLLPVRF